MRISSRRAAALTGTASLVAALALWPSTAAAGADGRGARTTASSRGPIESDREEEAFLDNDGNGLPSLGDSLVFTDSIDGVLGTGSGFGRCDLHEVDLSAGEATHPLHLHGRGGRRLDHGPGHDTGGSRAPGAARTGNLGHHRRHRGVPQGQRRAPDHPVRGRRAGLPGLRPRFVSTSTSDSKDCAAGPAPADAEPARGAIGVPVGAQPADKAGMRSRHVVTFAAFTAGVTAAAALHRRAARRLPVPATAPAPAVVAELWSSAVPEQDGVVLQFVRPVAVGAGVRAAPPAPARCGRQRRRDQGRGAVRGPGHRRRPLPPPPPGRLTRAATAGARPANPGASPATRRRRRSRPPAPRPD